MTQWCFLMIGFEHMNRVILERGMPNKEIWVVGYGSKGSKRGMQEHQQINGNGGIVIQYCVAGKR
jgi:hypothetical protein